MLHWVTFPERTEVLKKGKCNADVHKIKRQKGRKWKNSKLASKKERKKREKVLRNYSLSGGNGLKLSIFSNKANSVENGSTIPLSSIETVFLHKKTFDGEALLPWKAPQIHSFRFIP